MSWRRREEGFTLIEIAAALGVFAVVMVSLTLLFDSALDRANRTRSDELGKTIAQAKMEEIRSLAFHVPWTEVAAPVDLLDFYYPDTTGPSPIPGATGAYNGTANVWTFTTTQSTTQDGRTYQVETALQFVRPLDNGTLEPEAPIAGYQSDQASVDEPATGAVRAVVTVSRTVAGQPRTVRLESVISSSASSQPSVEATGSLLGAQVSGLTFQDGEPAAGGVAAEILAEVAKAQTAFREVAESTSQASSDPLQIVERDPVTGVSIQPEGPTTGQTSASVPNSTTGTTQARSVSISGGTFPSLNGTGAIAGWDGESPSSTAEARVSLIHTLNPEGKTTVESDDVEINARNPLDLVPLRMVTLGRITGSVEQTSTTTQSRVRSVVDIDPEGDGDDDDDEGDPAVAVVATRQFNLNNDFEGVLLIGSLHVDAEAIAGTITASTSVNWTVSGLRIWDPDANQGQGAYGPSYTFGFDSTCGGWEDDPTTGAFEGPSTGRCGVTRVDQTKQPFENPNPVIIPAAYAGTDNAGAPATSLSVVAGITVRDTQPPANGVASAAVAQKNILAITTREDVAGAVQLESMLLGLGDANVNVSYIDHEH
jgi:type II secretory pathway pseudopilin PulG